MGVRVTAGSVSGGGGASLTHQASRTLDNDEVIALPNSYYILVPAPGSDRVTVLEGALLSIDASGAAYGNLTAGANGTIYLGPDPNPNGFQQSIEVLASQFLNSAAIKQTWLRPQLHYDNILTAIYAVAWEDGSNNSVGLTAINSGNYTLGDASNSMDIGMLFKIWSTTEKRFLTVSESGWNQATRTFA